MGQSWSGLRKELEEDFLCESLKGRVQYFLTHYHKAPDQYGRVCVRVDGKEVLHGNPYDFYVLGYQIEEWRLKRDLEIPDRAWTGKEYLYEEENEVVEDYIRDKAVREGVFEIFDFTDAIREYKQGDVFECLHSKHLLVRMLAVMDRRVGKRTLLKLAGEISELPEWLVFFYELRFEAEGIRY